MWTEAGQAQLDHWGLTPADAGAAGLFEVPNASAVLAGVPQRPGVIIPYYDTAGQIMRVNGMPFGRVRWTDTPKRSMYQGKVKTPRYGQPPGVGVQVYFPPMLDWADVLADPKRPILITEGEIKALVATLRGYTCIALGGVYNFTGDKLGNLLGILDEAQWKNRPVAIVYDSDAATNPNVLAAEARLVEELGTKRGADVRIVRLPDEGGEKVGLDDFLHKHGTEELDALIYSAASLGQLDSKIIALNKTCAWIEQEKAVYDMETGLLIQRADFVNGSRFSTLTHITAAGPKAQPKTLRISELWLKHPHAQRYSQMLFKPGEPAVIEIEGRRVLNLWQGWTAEPGDITPWLRLAEHVLSNEPQQELRDLPLKLFAYKAQHPQEKIPLALALVGGTGTGKTLYFDAVRDAFMPYATTVAPSSLALDYHPWLEKSVMATIHEIDGPTLQKNAEMLKALITDERRQLNDKYRTLREVNSPTFYMLSSNHSAVAGGFSLDDRRILAFTTPAPGPDKLYDDVLAWRAKGGARFLMHYLLNLDLGDWRPPRRAPATSSKKMAYREGMTPIAILAADMRESSFNTLLLWLDLAVQYGGQMELSSDPRQQAMGRAVRDSVQHIQVRPWYTAEELVTIFPSVLGQMYATDVRHIKEYTPGQMSRMLRDNGIPFLVNRDNPDGFMWQGKMRQYLVVSQFDDWAQPVTQADFERAMRNWPTYQQIKQQGKK